MNTNDLLARWSTMSVEQIEAELQKAEDSAAAEQLYGPEELAELRDLASQTRSLRGPRQAVIYLPGFMGSLLASIRGETTLVWLNPALYLQGKANYLELAADGIHDASPRVEIAPTGIEKIFYLKMALALRKEALLFEFPYDWRRPIEQNGRLLRNTIERWAAGAADMQFTLVGHSMGGLVSRSYLAQFPAEAERRVRRLIMLGTPHFGAAGAVGDMALGNSMMDLAKKVNKNNQLRNLPFDMPSVYQLLPAPRELWPASRDYPTNFDLYDAAAWGVPRIRQDYLDAGKAFHHLLAGADPQVETSEVAGCHLETITDVIHRLTAGDSPHFQIVRQKEGSDSGDSTVPLWSARLPGAAMYYLQVVHRSMCRDKDVIEATLDLVQSGVCDLPSEIPEPKAGFLGWRGPSGSLDSRAGRLRIAIEEGDASEADLEQLFFMNL